MITPRQLKNLANDNTLQDWLERHHVDRDKYQQRHVRDFQNQFKKHIIEQLKLKLGPGEMAEMGAEMAEMAEMAVGADLGLEMSKLINGKETLEHMKNKVPVIVNAHLINRSEGICDIADMLVRSDYICHLFPYAAVDPMPVSSMSSGPSKYGNWHYVAVGFRFGKNEFCVDGAKLRNCPSVRFWKTKLYMQTRILNHYQQTTVNYALIVGHSYTWTMSKAVGGHTRSNNTYEKPAYVLFTDDFDRPAEVLFNTGKTWLQRLDEPQAADWVVAPVPSVPELYANGKLSIYDTPWAPVIHDYAVKQNDITLLHHCTADARRLAHSKGILNLKSATKSEDLGYKSTSSIGGQINRYLSGRWNRLSDLDLEEDGNSGSDAIYLDFESVTNASFSRGSTNLEDWIYLVSITEPSGQTIQYGLTSLPNRTYDTVNMERQLASDLYKYLCATNAKYIYCWSDAEARYLFKLEERYPEFPLGTLFAFKLVDLLENFVNLDVILKGQTDNKLETVAMAVGLSVTKVPVNTNLLVEEIMWGDRPDKMRQSMLDQLLMYSRNDTHILWELTNRIRQSGAAGRS
jgi:hypothetical protein